MKTLTFYFDFISPYAYLAWTQIHPLAERYGWEVDPKPVLFAALLDANGQKGPAEIPRKRSYTFKDVTRSAHRLGVPLAAPASHPFNPLLALRVASSDRTSGERRAVIDALFAATWVKSLDVSASDQVEALLGEAGFDGRGLVAWAASPEAKDRVRQATAEALEVGAFGVPTIVAQGELFWGLDSFANLELFLNGKGPPVGPLAASWNQVTASASRPAADRQKGR